MLYNFGVRYVLQLIVSHLSSPDSSKFNSHECMVQDHMQKVAAVHLCFFSCVAYAEVVIGFEQTTVTVFEQQDSAELCASIMENTLARTVDVALSTQPGTATGEPTVSRRQNIGRNSGERHM